MIHFLSPSMLLLLTLLIPLWAVARGQAEQADRLWAWSRRGSLCLRSLSVVALTGALAGTEIMVKNTDLSVIYLLDRSDSLSTEQRDRAQTYVREALPLLPTDVRAGVVVFGQRALVQHTLSYDRTLGPVVEPPS